PPSLWCRRGQCRECAISCEPVLMIGWDYHCVGNIERRRQVSLQACDGAPPDRGGRLSSSVVSAPARQGAALRVSDGVVQVRVQERGLLQLLVQLDVVGLAFVDQLSEM